MPISAVMKLVEYCSASSYHSLNLPTHSVRSPRVSNVGYVSAATNTLGKALLTRARRCSGKAPKVLSFPYNFMRSCPCVDNEVAYFETMDEA